MEWLNNRYVRLTLLGVLMAALIYIIIWIIFAALGIKNFPQMLQVALALLGSGLLVYKFFEQRIF